jgi:hypothetical protein
VTTSFREAMAGSIRLAGESSLRPFRLELAVVAPGWLPPWGTTDAVVTGRVSAPGWADDPGASGTMEISPLERRRIRYRLGFVAADGRRLYLDGWKSVTARHPVRSMTVLPATVTDSDGAVVGEARLRFDVSRDLLRFLRSFRHSNSEPGEPGMGSDHLASRWRGQTGRLEVWYTTLTDPATGTGVWLHHELVAPAGGADPFAHGWAAVFPPGAPPLLRRFGPHPWAPTPDGAPFTAGEVRAGAARLHGTAGDIAWDLKVGGGGPPLYTFPRWAWERELLPAAQIVPAPGAAFTGTVRTGEYTLDLDGAPGATGRIYGHGNARRWAWLHADLGDGDVLELVAAVSTRPGLRSLPALPFLALRVDGRTWPSRPLLATVRMRARIGLPTWTVRGRIGRRRITVEVTQPREATVAVDYADPDGAPAVCHNTERASATITTERWQRGWQPERRWHLDGTAHAEVGLRDGRRHDGGRR